MTQPISHPAPPLREVVGEQVRTVGHALRRPALAAAALVAVGTLLPTIQLVREPNGVDFGPEHQMLPGILGLLFPIAVWQGEKRFGDGFLWTLPVDRRGHALAKVFAGWVWLLAAVAFFTLWLAVLTLASGGSFLGEETRQLVTASELPGRVLDPSTLRTRQMVVARHVCRHRNGLRGRPAAAHIGRDGMLTCVFRVPCARIRRT